MSSMPCFIPSLLTFLLCFSVYQSVLFILPQEVIKLPQELIPYLESFLYKPNMSSKEHPGKSMF